MGFTDLAAAAGLTTLNSFLESKSYIVGNSPSQADVTIYKALSGAPDAEKYPHAARWYKHIASHETDFETLPGEKSTDISKYGPDATENAVNPAAAPKAADDDDDVDLFASDDEEEDAEKAALTAKRLEEYRAKKALKPKTIAKSIVTLDVKTWDDETNMGELAEKVKNIEKDGLVWGTHSFEKIGYGVEKLRINCVVEDDKISIDKLSRKIMEVGTDDFEGRGFDEDFDEEEEYEGEIVQSVDVHAMQKL